MTATISDERRAAAVAATKQAPRFLPDSSKIPVASTKPTVVSNGTLALRGKLNKLRKAAERTLAHRTATARLAQLAPQAATAAHDRERSGLSREFLGRG